MAGATYICGEDDTPGARGTDCPNALHDHPLPAGYVSASMAAARRIGEGWSNKRCPDCSHHGWTPPTEGTPDGR